jgi:hypothetical protein
MKHSIALTGLLGVVFLLAAPAAGRMLPHKSVEQLCFEAELILAGEHLGEGAVRVGRVYWPPEPAARATLDGGDVVLVPSLPHHSKVAGFLWSQQDDPPPPLATRQVVLFLTRSPQGHCTPIDPATSDVPTQGGSQGAFWYDDSACFGYMQIINPGPYILVAGNATGFAWRMPANFQALQQQIEAGIDQRQRWQAVRELPDLGDRARAVAAYLLPRTAPEGYGQSLDIRKELFALCHAAIPAMVEVLRTRRPEDRLNPLLGALWDIGSTHPGSLTDAVMPLCDLLDDSQAHAATSLFFIVCALTAAADPRAAPHMRPMLKHDDSQVRQQAARALAAMKDVESFDDIESMLDVPPPLGQQRDYTKTVALALFSLDPQRARPIIEQLEAAEGNAGLRNFIPGYHTIEHSHRAREN